VSAPDVMTNPETEPEASHLRNVLRQIGVILGDDRRLLVDRTLMKIAPLVRDALERPATNGAVIDALVKENGDLQSKILDMQDRLRQFRETLIARQVGQ
jgi:hypothetical protein